MITVSILINGQPIFTRTAFNQGKPRPEAIYNAYLSDDGKKILHNPDDGAVKLAMKMLKEIKEQK